MIVGYSNDGQKIDKDTLIKEGFNINEIRDFRKKDDSYVLDFVGFTTNDNDDIFCVFPKNYIVNDINTDSAQLFKLIGKHMQKRPELYLGDEYGKIFKSSYPFSSFFGVYDYFKEYGLYFENKVHIKPNIGGNVRWKETIRLSNKYFSNGIMSLFPIYYEKKYYFTELLTECMIFVIDYTIDKFGMFIGFDKTENNFSEFDFIEQKEFILENLIIMREQVFKDRLIELIDHLINFFSQLNEGGSYYFKHYSFSSIWEDMVRFYLESNYKEIQGDKIIFDKSRPRKLKFEKPKFYPNKANAAHHFIPDYYCEDGSTQLIFDAKYYTNIIGMDYKQISYYLFLNEYRENETDPSPKFSSTYSALLLPSHSRHSKIHFKMDPRYNKSNQRLVISEEYLDIREVIDFYLD